MKFEQLYTILLESFQAKWGIVFRKKGNIDTGCCIGVKHGKQISASKEIIERIKQIPNLKFYAEGIAAQKPNAEPGMMPFINKNFDGAKIEKLSWDEITEKNNKGTGNVKYNVVYTFMQHRFNKTIDRYPYTKGTMLEALAKPNIKNFPINSPQSFEERLEWLTQHIKKAGFYDKLNQPYDKNKLLKIMDDMEYTVYPDQEYPDESTYFGQMQHKLEEERNQTIYDLIGNGGCCIAGAGHLIELKRQFSDLEIIDEDRV